MGILGHKIRRQQVLIASVRVHGRDGERFARGRDAFPRLNFLPRNKRVVCPELVEGFAILKNRVVKMRSPCGAPRFLSSV
jgi:hypothetical protein